MPSHSMTYTRILHLHQDFIRSHFVQQDSRHCEISFGLLYYKRLGLQWERECSSRLGVKVLSDGRHGTGNC